MLGMSQGTSRASPVDAQVLGAGARGDGDGDGTRGRREARFYSQTNAELRARAEERDMGGPEARSAGWAGALGIPGVTVTV